MDLFNDVQRYIIEVVGTAVFLGGAASLLNVGLTQFGIAQSGLIMGVGLVLMGFRPLANRVRGSTTA